MTSIRSNATSDLSGALPWRSAFLTGMITNGAAPQTAPIFNLTTPSTLLFAARFLAALLPAFPRGGLAALFPAAGAALLAAFIGLVHGRPGARFRFLLRDPAFLVAFFDVFCFPFLLRRVFLFASSCHGSLLIRFRSEEHTS